MRWVMRVKENRSVEPEDSSYRLPDQYQPWDFRYCKTNETHRFTLAPELPPNNR